MPPQTEPKFLYISTQGFVPLFDPADKKAAARLSSQIRELASGTFHDGVKNDPDLEGKDLSGFLAMVADGKILFRNRSDENPALSISINYASSVLKLDFDRIYVTPPVIQSKLDDKILKISIDLRIDLKKLLPPRSLPDFVKVAAAQKTQGLSFSYLASKKTDIFGNSCNIFTLGEKNYSTELLASKREFPK